MKEISTLRKGAGLAMALAAVVACSPKPGTGSTAEPAGNGDVFVASLEVSNPSEFARQDQALNFSLQELGLEASDPRVATLSVRRGDSTVTSQLIDRSGDGNKDHLFFISDFSGAEKQNFELVFNTDQDTDQNTLKSATKRSQAEISHKVGGQWQAREKNPELLEYVGGEFKNVARLVAPAEHTDHSQYLRYEGPGIESEKVGYRIYLDWRNGFDVFGKQTPAMSLQNVGQDGYDSYHHMADWGMDILKVGSSLGAGGYGYWNGDKVERVSKVEQWQAAVIENGDLYSALEIDYRGWQVADKKLDLKAKLSMTAGSRLVHTRVSLSDSLPNMAIGLVKHAGTKFIQGDINITGRAWTYVASYGKQSLNGDNLGMALIFKKNARIQQGEDEHNYVSVLKTPRNMLEYYFLAAWEGEQNGIKTEAEFIAYLEQEVERLTIAPRVSLKTSHGQAQKTFPITSEQALKWSQRLADSELKRKTLAYAYGGYDYIRERKPYFEYTTGLLMQAYDNHAAVAPNAKYDAAVIKVMSSFVTDDGEILGYDLEKYNIDSVNSGKMLLRMYQKTGDKKYKIAAGHLRRQLTNHPRTSEGAFWHKKRYPYQLWLDGVYMGLPFLSQYTALFEDGHSFEEVVKEFQITRKRLRDPATGLYFHAWDEKQQQSWADPETGLSKFHWGRGMGWLSMALVDVLDDIPPSQTELRQPLLQMLNEVADTLVRYQDPATGTWWQILDMPNKPGNYLESSASSMFVYSLAKAINKGYIDDRYRAPTEKAYQGLINNFINISADNEVSITNMCLVAGLGYGRDGSYRYYMSEPIYKNDPKATAPFIMAGVEMSQLLASKK